MLEDPRLDLAELTDAIRAGYGLSATRFGFVRGYDQQAVSYRLGLADGQDRFLKVRLSPPSSDVPLEVPRALLDAGIDAVLAPIRTLDGQLAHPIGDGRSLVLYPFAAGRSGMSGMDEAQWRSFGRALRAVHDSDLERQFADRLPAERFALPSADQVRALLEGAGGAAASAERLARLLTERGDVIGRMLDRAAELRRRLATRNFERVLCHADIHAANLLITDDSDVLLVDWDGPMLAPRERDLLFVIGSRIARAVEPHEEAWFFAGYGEPPRPVDGEAIVYYRYERIFEDLAAIGESVHGVVDVPESSRLEEVELAESFFAPGGIIESVEWT
jgi:spectinomycin phosphotransferase